MLFAYFGPDTFMPLTSALAGLAGVVLIFGRTILAFVKLGCRRAIGVLRPAKKVERVPTGLPAGRKLRRDEAEDAPEGHNPAGRSKPVRS